MTLFRLNSLFSVALFGLVPSLPMAEGISEGIYTNGGSTIVVNGDVASVTIRQPGCLGELDGRLAQNSIGDWFLLGRDEPQCVLSLEPDEAFTLIVEQYENCSLYHGAACGFAGNYRRTE